jgi:hypothetical protein
MHMLKVGYHNTSIFPLFPYIPSVNFEDKKNIYPCLVLTSPDMFLSCSEFTRNILVIFWVQRYVLNRIFFFSLFLLQQICSYHVPTKSACSSRGHRSRDRMVVWFTTTYAISAWCCEFDQVEVCNIMWWSLSVTCDRSVVFFGYSGFLHQ